MSAARVTAENGTSATDFRYRNHALIKGKPPIDGLPATYANEEEAQTLAVTLYDNQTKVEAVLLYTVFEQLDAITRRVTVTNQGEGACTVNRLFSASLDFLRGDLELVQLYGGGADERHVERRPLSRAVTSVQSSLKPPNTTAMSTASIWCTAAAFLRSLRQTINHRCGC